MICDFAETYHILDYKGLKPLLVSTLLNGLRADSRTKLKLSGGTVPLETTLLAGCLDALNILVWSKTKQGQKGQKRPISVLTELAKETKPKQYKGYATADDFEKARKQLLGD